MRLLLLLCFAFVGFESFAEQLRFQGGCIGGEKCGQGREIFMNLGPTRDIENIQFYAHDNIGDSTEGKVDVLVDGYVVASYIDIKKAGSNIFVPVNRRGRHISIRAVTDDEVSVGDVFVEVRPNQNNPGSYRYNINRCIGGEQCGHYNTININLNGYYLDYLEFYAHDRIGDSTGGKVDVFVDGYRIAGNIDILKDGSVHRIYVGRYARNVEFRAASDDEVYFYYADLFFR